jgi:hypothetical protein
MKKILLVLLVMSLFSCADVSPHVSVCITSNAYGFWGGLWHGMIFPFSWIGSLFSDNIAIYAYNNNGGWYDFGFILGLVGVLGGGSSKASK